MDNKKYIPEIDLGKFDYDLPEHRIAEFPEPDRQKSRLLVSRPCGIEHRRFYEIPELLPENSLLIINNTKVIAARILMSKPTGGRAEILAVDPIDPSNDPQITMQARGKCIWNAIIGGRRIREGVELAPAADYPGIDFSAKILNRSENRATVEFRWSPSDMSFAGALARIGRVPLPPYIHREAVESDTERYQTGYAEREGSIAAPTAGLRFTPEILGQLDDRGIDRAELILHVGPGTFRPIDSADIARHEMHSEQIFISKSSINKIIRAIESGKKIIATGTTSVRTLESLYWHGVKLIRNEAGRNIEIAQWDPYRLAVERELPSNAEALAAVTRELERSGMEFATGHTSLFIVPGFHFRIVDILITNFHMPKSTLILLVAAFAGLGRWRNIYDEALANGYRFLSYGDSSLLFRE